ncbi:MAG TPA: transposase family protein, partial [Pirellulales bacterium]|nr:transposase family protein [Pirellulales bacterium]
LLPQKPNDLWQMDVTYVHIPGHGWWYAVTVIDYYSRYLLACHLTPSYSALEATHALKVARVEADVSRRTAIRWCRPRCISSNRPFAVLVPATRGDEAPTPPGPLYPLHCCLTEKQRSKPLTKTVPSIPLEL